jgi:hypothetical protein
MELKPVYPKEDPEYRKKVLEDFYRRIKNERWDAFDDNEYQGKPRGRKPKVVEKPVSKARTKGEQQAANKFFNYNK